MFWMSTVACLWDDRFRIGNAAEDWPRFRCGFGISRLHTRYRLSGRVAMAMQAGSTFPPRSDRTKSLQLPRRRLLLPIPGLPACASALHLLGVFGPLSGEREPFVSFASLDQLPSAPKPRLSRLIFLRAAIHNGSNRLHCQTRIFRPRRSCGHATVPACRPCPGGYFASLAFTQKWGAAGNGRIRASWPELSPEAGPGQGRRRNDEWRAANWPE